MSLTPAMEDYLEAVLIVAKTQVEVRSVDIARQLDVSKPSVWRAMTVLKGKKQPRKSMSATAFLLTA